MNTSDNDNTGSYHKIQINRAGEPMLEFNIRRLSAGECYSLWEQATKPSSKKKKRPKGKKVTGNSLFRAMVIYAATVDKDKAKTWDNAMLHETHGTPNPIDIIDRLLPSEAKDRVYMRICEFSGLEDKSYNSFRTEVFAEIYGNGGVEK